MSNALYIQSGGPTAVINATAYGVISEWKNKNEGKIFAALHGLNGVAQGDLFDCDLISEDDFRLLPETPSMYFGSTRTRISLDDESRDKYSDIIRVLNEYDIHAIFVNGGNGSVRACNELNHVLISHGYHADMIFIPKTVDNDIEGIDHAPGFASTARHVNICLSELAHDLRTYDSNLIMIVEVMGRMTGWLAASTIVAALEGNGPDLVYVPETSFSIKKLIEDVEAVYKKNGKCMVVVAEGVKDENGKFLFEYGALQDLNPQLNMGGVTSYLKSELVKHFDCKIRAIDLGLVQRCSSYTVSDVDKEEAIHLGTFAVDSLLDGETGKVVSVKRLSSNPYKTAYVLTDIKDSIVGNHPMPTHYINSEGNGINEDYLDYIKPLIGELPHYSKSII